MNPKPDETLEEIWAIRRRIAKRFSGNPQKRVAYYQRKQKESRAKLYRPEEHVNTDVQAYDALHDRAHSEITAGKFSIVKSYRTIGKRKAK